MKHLNLFQTPEHESFHWAGGPPAALLVHGFPGTPAEMRPLATILHQQDWTVQALLLPGLGRNIDTLFERQYTEWLQAVADALIELQHNHNPVLLIGYSMGAALALHVATQHSPTGLILLAPFWKMGSTWQKIIGIILRPFFRQIRPFKRANFSDPKIRQGINNLFSELNLDDPDIQQTLRELTIPISLFEQLARVGQSAFQSAKHIAGSTLIIQGVADEVVLQKNTRHLLRQIPGPIHYVEVTAGHNLIAPEQPAWPQIEHAVLDFAQQLLT